MLELIVTVWQMVLPNLLVVTDVIVTGLNHLDVFMADVFASVVACWPYFEMADGIAIVADEIATFVMTDVIVIVEME